MTDFSTIKKLFGIEKSEGFSEECVKEADYNLCYSANSEEHFEEIDEFIEENVL